MRRVTHPLLLLLLLVFGSAPAWADSWPGPTVFTVFGASGRHFVRFVPGDSVGDTVGFGKVVAIYAPSGKLVRGYELTDLYSSEKLEKIPHSISSRYWRCAPVHFVEQEQKSVYVPEALGGYFVFRLATGEMKYEAGSRTTCDSPNQPLSWSTLGR